MISHFPLAAFKISLKFLSFYGLIIQELARVSLQFWVCKPWSLFLNYYLLIIILFICISTVNLLLSISVFYLGVNVLKFNLTGVCWTSWMDVLNLFHQIWKLLQPLLLQIYMIFIPLSLSSHSMTPIFICRYTRWCSKVSGAAFIFLHSVPFCLLREIIIIVLSSSWLILLLGQNIA